MTRFSNLICRRDLARTAPLLVKDELAKDELNLSLVLALLSRDWRCALSNCVAALPMGCGGLEGLTVGFVMG